MFQKIKTRIQSIDRLFLLTVAAPTVIASLYFGLVASDVYISESRFVVRSPERQMASPLGLVLKGAGFSRAQDDIYTVQDYILSRDALKELNDKLNIIHAFSDLKIDFFNRFSGLDSDSSFEAFHRYYQKKVSVQNDSAASISTLTVRAFTAKDAVTINRKLLELSESLVNHLNERGRNDLIKFASIEAMHAEDKAKAAGLALSLYRNAKGVLDPERQATSQLQQIARLQDDLITTTTQLAQLKAFTPANPQIPALTNRADTLRMEIGKESSKVTGGELSLANKATEYQRLSLDREFAEKQLASAMASLESARNEAVRQQVYLERIVQPSTPDMAVEPRRLRGILATFLLSLVVWGVLSMLLAGVREHQD